MNLDLPALWKLGEKSLLRLNTNFPSETLRGDPLYPVSSLLAEAENFRGLLVIIASKTQKHQQAPSKTIGTLSDPSLTGVSFEHEASSSSHSINFDSLIDRSSSTPTSASTISSSSIPTESSFSPAPFSPSTTSTSPSIYENEGRGRKRMRETVSLPATRFQNPSNRSVFFSSQGSPTSFSPSLPPLNELLRNRLPENSSPQESMFSPSPPPNPTRRGSLRISDLCHDLEEVTSMSSTEKVQSARKEAVTPTSLLASTRRGSMPVHSPVPQQTETIKGGGGGGGGLTKSRRTTDHGGNDDPSRGMFGRFYISQSSKDEFNKEKLQCQRCGTKETPEWRRGPHGPKTLCNACGLKYAKVLKRNTQATHDSTDSYEAAIHLLHSSIAKKDDVRMEEAAKNQKGTHG
mmetsp:Transcript_38102/g.52938  ORF Transcript_38102/g.52938 Transcript_38102/m.52938 type:complete len:404 (+) Transcript_38102:35-1246(+)|eukprot:CAMPEP_0201475170 /NCGR_PEP_ID=MMETSP0151_2-20130828/618_1 /ASSEMBLY_ACC=CAM_ASM_000257 /TAXON_ID=200890 /ORGANISM="Paramoeba atlantica, Strain 621/1 / CCAP 1560/9" /LENGTH=403 /DNA_ID=CAMNT_0047855187 /DNA_START=35 /DNA_END=1246 /DNA_ORIENTATION=-